MGDIPDQEHMPLDIYDFPPLVREAMEIFNRLGDKYTSTDLGPLYIGKDINTIQILFDIMDISCRADQKLILEIVQHLDNKIVKQAVSKMKQEAKKLKNKAK